MPIYSYECTEKGHSFTDMCSVSTMKEDRKCPQCGAVSLYKPTFTSSFQYGKDYDSFAANTARWNKRENHRLGKG